MNLTEKITENFDACVGNVLGYYEQATAKNIEDGLNWYPKAYNICEEIANFYSRPVEEVANVVAIMSPRNRWRVNIDYAIRIYDNAKLRRKPLNLGVAFATPKAHDLIYRGVNRISGPKVISFRNCILGSKSDVCVDTWALRVVYNEPEFKKTFKLGTYKAAQSVYRAAAEMLPVTPVQLQAITWCVIRGDAN